MKRMVRLSSLLLVPLCLLLPGDRPAKPVHTPWLVRLPASADHHGPWAPRMRRASGRTMNWAGYVVETNLVTPEKKSVTDVQGSWRVPSVSASDTNTYSAIWVGLDGSSNRTVEQIGTEQDWSSGGPVYYAWFEMYPQRGYQIMDFPVSPGDRISAEVQWISKTSFNLMITNLTQSVGFSIVRKRSAQRTSAEWIVEAPYFRRVLSLADFGAATFTACSATVTGVTGAINNATWQNESVTMETAKSVVTAQPGGLTSGGTSFTVTWEHQ